MDEEEKETCELCNAYKELVENAIDTFEWAKGEKGKAYQYAVEDLMAAFVEFLDEHYESDDEDED